MKKWSECIKRALRTFIEAAAAYLAAHIVLAVSTGGEDLSVMRTALMGLAVSSVAAGLAAVLNMPKKAAGTEDAAAGGAAVSGSTADAGLVEPDAAGGVSDAAIGAKEGRSVGGGQSAKSDLPDAEYGADKSAIRTVPEADIADLSGATCTVPEAEDGALSGTHGTAVGENMADGAGNKGIL